MKTLMISSPSLRRLSALSLLLLAACQAPQAPRVVSLPEPEPVPVVEEFDEAAAQEAFEKQLRYQRILADWLYEGIKALNANRLLTPPDSSAHAYFSRVLAIEPDNAVALQGIQDIVVKYLQLAEQAGRQGQFDSAKDYLRKAEQVNIKHPGIDPAWAQLEAEMNSTDVVLPINARALASQSEDLMAELGRIGVQARDTGAFFLITAPNDAQARWIYAQMQAAVVGHRLRGNIELGDSPTVRLIMPSGGDA